MTSEPATAENRSRLGIGSTTDPVNVDVDPEAIYDRNPVGEHIQANLTAGVMDADETFHHRSGGLEVGDVQHGRDAVNGRLAILPPALDLVGLPRGTDGFVETVGG